MSKNTAPLAIETVTEATQAGDEAKRTLEKLRALPVTRDNVEMVGSILVDIKERYKALEGRQRAITQPMRQAEKAVRDLFRPALAALAEAEALLKTGIAQAHAAAFAQNQAAMTQAQAALAAGDARGAALAATNLAPIEAPAGVTLKEAWSFRIVDSTAVPRAYCIPDEGLIRAAIRAGIREIAGVVIEPTTQVSVRTG